MNTLSYLLLNTVYKLQGERSVNGAIHLLRGKRSAQTIQDIHLFSLETYAASLKQWPEEDINKMVTALYRGGFLSQSNQTTLLSKKGTDWLKEAADHFELPSAFHGFNYEWDGKADYFWGRLVLTVQSVSNLVYANPSFIPVSYDRLIQQDVKSVLKAHPDRSKLGRQLYSELKRIYEPWDEQDAALLVKRFSSNKKTGKTISQLSGLFNHDHFYTFIYCKSLVHKMLASISSTPDLFPVLSQLLPRIEGGPYVTQTARQTKDLLNKGFSLEEIAEKRKLKLSTIEDHVIEISIYDPFFKIHEFLPEQERLDIIKASERLNTNRLKPIKDLFQDKYTYFQIRLALSTLRKGGNYDAAR
ncbi:helix-turn-helix domain-containing protein [Salipaludibacillus aurantiacus]|uniref:Uncharacterized protein YpbB n=1 Tax=Salipaludibacillus aurantiacus TaxID=1601833 RepID=A0A1H9PBQ8_9BACI|nr:helix-turn-helix domain-containing protein [Salipaludibacillus aurantiacus]SER45636.1 Uncharacterized protein YpbB [Salipaludibacillus aurantiacus]